MARQDRRVDDRIREDNGDDSGYDLNEQYNRAAARWEWKWYRSTVVGMSTCAGRGLPAAGQVIFPPGVVIGGAGGGPELRLTTGALTPTTGLWNRGDRVYNSAAAMGSVEGWVCTQRSGWGPAWTSARAVYIGDAIEPSVANGFVYQCTDLTTGTAEGFTSAPGGEPVWPLVVGLSVTENAGTVTWTCFGPTPGVFRSFGLVN